MSKEFIKINSVSNEDGNDMFNAICKDILHKKPNEVRNDLGLPVASKVTTKDLITLIQEKGLECEIKVTYDKNALVPLEPRATDLVQDDSDPFA